MWSPLPLLSHLSCICIFQVRIIKITNCEAHQQTIFELCVPPWGSGFLSSCPLTLLWRSTHWETQHREQDSFWTREAWEDQASRARCCHQMTKNAPWPRWHANSSLIRAWRYIYSQACMSVPWVSETPTQLVSIPVFSRGKQKRDNLSGDGMPLWWTTKKNVVLLRSSIVNIATFGGENSHSADTSNVLLKLKKKKVNAVTYLKLAHHSAAKKGGRDILTSGARNNIDTTENGSGTITR